MVKKEKVTTDPEDIQEPSLYEIGYHLVPILGEGAVSAEVAKVREIIEGEGGVPTSDQFPARLPLSYEMSRQIAGKRQQFTEAYFGWMEFEIPPSALERVKESIDRNENILRFIIKRTEHVKESSTAPIVQPLVTEKKESDPASEKPEISEEKQLSDEELDKTIDELVIE